MFNQFKRFIHISEKVKRMFPKNTKPKILSEQKKYNSIFDHKPKACNSCNKQVYVCPTCDKLIASELNLVPTLFMEPDTK